MRVPFPVVAADVANLAREMAIWGRVPVYCSSEYVSTGALAATQHEVVDRHLDEIEVAAVERDLPPIDVADIGGVFVIVNGHHRATVARRARRSTIWATVRRRAEEPKR